MLNIDITIEGCVDCGTFQKIPTHDLKDLGIDELICEKCLKERLDNDQSQC